MAPFLRDGRIVVRFNGRFIGPRRWAGADSSGRPCWAAQLGRGEYKKSPIEVGYEDVTIGVVRYSMDTWGGRSTSFRLTSPSSGVISNPHLGWLAGFLIWFLLFGLLFDLLPGLLPGLQRELLCRC
jgi:hypothetical protein